MQGKFLLALSLGAMALAGARPSKNVHLERSGAFRGEFSIRQLGVSNVTDSWVG